MITRTLFKVFAIGVLTCGTSILAAAETGIEGDWTPVQGKNSGLGTIWIFGAEGKLTSVFGAVVDGDYQIEGDQIKLIEPDNSSSGGKPPITFSFVVSDDAMSLTLGPPAASVPKRGGAPQSFTRVGERLAGAAPIVGEWLGPDLSTSNPQGPSVRPTYRFSRSGVMQLRLPMQSESGSYRLADGVLTVALPGETKSFKVEIEPDVITLRLNRGDTFQLKRFKY
jgi:hypothetical protein